MSTHPEDQAKNEYREFLKRLGEFFRVSREESGYKNAKTFADVIDITESQYREYERGETDMQLSTLLKILKGLEKSIDDVVSIGLPSNQNLNVGASLIAESEYENQVRNQVRLVNGNNIEESLDTDDINRILKILINCYRPLKKNDILKAVGLSVKTAKFSKIFSLLLQNGWVAMKFPDNANTPTQRYYTTEQGKVILKLE